MFFTIFSYLTHEYSFIEDKFHKICWCIQHNYFVLYILLWAFPLSTLGRTLAWVAQRSSRRCCASRNHAKIICKNLYLATVTAIGIAVAVPRWKLLSSLFWRVEGGCISAFARTLHLFRISKSLLHQFQAFI